MFAITRQHANVSKYIVLGGVYGPKLCTYYKKGSTRIYFYFLVVSIVLYPSPKLSSREIRRLIEVPD